METSETAPPAEAASFGSRRPGHTAPRPAQPTTAPHEGISPAWGAPSLLTRGTTAPWAEKLGAGQDQSRPYRVGRVARSPSPGPLWGAARTATGAGGAPAPPPGGLTPPAPRLPPARMRAAAPGFTGRGLCSRPGCDGRAAFSWLDFVLSRCWFAPSGEAAGRRSAQSHGAWPLGCFSIRNPFWPPTSENVPESRPPGSRVLVSHSTFKAELCLAALHQLQLNLHLVQKKRKASP